MLKRPQRITCDQKFGLVFLTGMLFFASLIILNMLWREIKGSHFLNPQMLSTARGVIVSSRTERGGVNSTGLHYVIWYEYAVAGKRFHSDQITFSYRGDISTQFAQNYVDKYPVGRFVTIYYDQHNPSFSVIEPDARGDFRGALIAPIVLGLILFIELIWLFRGRNHSKEIEIM